MKDGNQFLEQKYLEWLAKSKTEKNNRIQQFIKIIIESRTTQKKRAKPQNLIT
jgi:hypothetical protein